MNLWPHPVPPALAPGPAWVRKTLEPHTRELAVFFSACVALAALLTWFEAWLERRAARYVAISRRAASRRDD